MTPALPHPSALEQREPDDALWAGLRTRQPEALRALVQRYERPLLDLATRYVSSGDAEDVVTEAFMLVWQATDRLDAIAGNSWGYLSRVVRNRCIDRLRRANCRPTESVEVTNDHEHPAPGPMALATDSEVSERLWSAVRELPAAQSQALLGAYSDGLSHAELAKELSIPLGTVKTRIRLGLESLRQKLGSLH